MKKFRVVLFVGVLCLMVSALFALPPITDGLVIQLDARSLSLTDGDPVAVWSDQSGGGNDATQETADNQPAFIVSSEEFNNRPVVRFDGSNDCLLLPSDTDCPIDVTSFTVLIYAKFSSIDANAYLIAGQASSADNGRLRICNDVAGGGFLFRVGNSTWKGIVATADTDVHKFAVTSTVEGFVDGVSINTTTNTSTDYPQAFNLGSYNNGEKDFFNGDIAEVLVYNRVLTTEELETINTYFEEGFLPNPSPVDGDILVPLDTAVLAWDTPDVGFTPSKYVLTMRADDPNFLDTANNTVIDPVVDLNSDAGRVEAAMPVTLDYGISYYWRVDVFDGDTEYPGTSLKFTTAPLDKFPVVDAGSNYITWLDNLPLQITGSIDDSGEGDVADVDIEWSIVGYPGDPVDAVARVLDRGVDSSVAAELKDAGYDPNMLSDWIGTDVSQTGNPLVITLSDLPAATYSWKSYHHDYSDQTGTFNVYVNGVMVEEDVDISDENNTPTEFTTTFNTDGTDVELIFEKNEDEYNANAPEYKIFVINAFELSDSSNILKVDFNKFVPSTVEGEPDTISPTATGFVAYNATNADLSSFISQSYSLGSSTVTVLSEWGAMAAGLIDAAVTKTSSDPLNPAAELTANYPGEYTIQLAATDSAGQADSDTMVVNVAADACAAAQLSDSWVEFNYFDLDQNCVVNLSDFAEFAVSWLEDISAVSVEAY